jgi:predicted RNA methylase
MAVLADLRPGTTVLEPSAGSGHLLQAVRTTEPAAITLGIDIEPRYVEQLRREGYTMRQADFLSVQPAEYRPFDVVLMNPPFTKAQDCHHVCHALAFLRPGGRLVAIMAAGVTFRQTMPYRRCRDLLSSYGATVEALPAQTFHASGTDVTTVLVVVTKPIDRKEAGTTEGTLVGTFEKADTL